MINTHEELFQKLKEYESKWGKLGHTNIMRPELNHTGSKGGSKMLKMDNEYYEFRRKVAEGSKKNRLAHASTISPDELNERYEQELVDRGSLIHAANGMKGQQFQNTKYYKREGEPGHYRYYYTKEEWDAAHANGNAADANREAQARSAYETNKKIENYKNKQNVTNTSSNTRENNLQADFTKKFSDIARQSPEAAAKEIINDENTKIKTFYNKIDDGFRKGIIVWKNGRFEMGENASDSDYENIKDEIESYSDQLEKFVKDVDTAAGSGRKTKDAIAKIMVDEIESMYQKAEKGKENLKANQNSREETSSAMGDEIIDEYKAFQEKVKAGAERHRLAHSSFISPEELNAKYQEELENNRIICHASNGQNYGYYQKIEKYYPDGSTRYFYTKEQWDAYQKGLKLQKQAEVHNQQVSNYEKNKAASQHEGDRYNNNNTVKKDQKATTPKIMNEQERKQMYEDLSKKAKIHNQQIETFRKNAEAAKHEGDRFIKDVKNVIKDSTKNAPEQPKTPESEIPKQNNIEEQKKQEAANKEIEKRNTINYITETFNNSDLAENWAQAVAFTDVYGADESAKKVLADNNVSMDNTVQDVMNQLREAYGEDAAQEFFNNAQAILQEKYNKYYTLYISQKNATDQANQQMMNQMMFGY